MTPILEWSDRKYFKIITTSVFRARDIIIYKKYIFAHSDHQNIFSLYPQFTASKTLGVSWVISAMEACFIKMFGLLLSVSEITSEPKKWNGCLVICNNSFPPQLALWIVTFEK